jgi:abortive infection bacteriophage resistance protein
MQYRKPPTSFEQQADLLISRGLIADRDILIDRLRAVNYYRLSGYLYSFRQPDDTYRPGTTISMVWDRYNFDRKLRLTVMDAIECVEVAIRTQLVYHFTHKFGPFGYFERNNFPKLSTDKYSLWINDLKEETDRSRETFVNHFFTKYGDSHKGLPLWMLAEIMSFGKMFTMFNGVDFSIEKRIAAEYQITDEVLCSWLGSLNVIRNICAHHGRLWNRELGYKPKLPYQRKNPQWYIPLPISNNRVFVILTILNYMIHLIEKDSQWSMKIKKLIFENPMIPIREMGFPIQWQEYSFWKDGV